MVHPAMHDAVASSWLAETMKATKNAAESVQKSVKARSERVYLREVSGEAG
jgi:hypothetical protein